MKISENMPQFKKLKALLLVSGANSATIYRINNNQIELKSEFALPRPESEFTDNEGHFMRSGRGMVFGYGSTREPQKEFGKKQFFIKVTEELQKWSDKEVESIYLFVPDYLSKELRDSLPAWSKEKIVATVTGNYTKSHPNELLQLLREKKEQARPEKIVLGKEAQKLLKE